MSVERREITIEKNPNVYVGGTHRYKKERTYNPSWKHKGEEYEAYYAQEGRTSVLRKKNVWMIDKLLHNRDKKTGRYALTKEQYEAGKKYIKAWIRVEGAKNYEIQPYADRGNMAEVYNIKMIKALRFFHDLNFPEEWHGEMVHGVCIDEVRPYRVCMAIHKDRNKWRSYLQQAFDSLVKG